MSDVTRYEALMLEHLYGLLDAGEARDLEAFLATADGADLRMRAETWKQKLASAARAGFPKLQFAAPAEPKSNSIVRPAALSTATMKAIWTRWIVAASLLIVFGGLGAPAAYQFVGWYAQSSETASALRGCPPSARIGEDSRSRTTLNARRDSKGTRASDCRPPGG